MHSTADIDTSTPVAVDAPMRPVRRIVPTDCLLYGPRSYC